MIAPRDLGTLVLGVVAAVSGVLAAVEVNTIAAPPPEVTAEDSAPPPEVTADDSAPPTEAAADLVTAPTIGAVSPGSSPELGSIPAAIREVLGSFVGAASAPLDQDALAPHLPPAITEVLTERGAVLVVPPDAEVVP